MTKLRFDPTLTFGNLLTVVSLAIMAIIFILKMDARLSVLERIVAGHDHRIESIETRIPPGFQGSLGH